MTTNKHSAKGNTLLPHYAIEAIEAVLLYLWESERIDYESCPPANQQKHIFRHLKTVSRWLKLHTRQTER